MLYYIHMGPLSFWAMTVSFYWTEKPEKSILQIVGKANTAHIYWTLLKILYVHMVLCGK